MTIPLKTLTAAGLLCCLGVVGVAPAARAADAADKSGFTLLMPTPDADLRDFSPDRPAKADSPYTVDAGHFQIEGDFLDVTATKRSGLSTHTFETADPVLKLGLTNAIDLEVTLGGYNTLRSIDRATGALLERDKGYGDTTVLTKFNLLGNDKGDVVLAVSPYLKVPTGAAGIGDGTVEGGVIAPLLLKLPQDFEVTLQTEVDVLANENGPGTHVAFANIAEVSHPVPGLKDVTAFAEFYSQVTAARQETNIYTADVALAYQVDPNLQLDVGANFGLNRGAPDTEVYSGVARRF
ncbi:transporter [Lichenihabitans sp. Uapishka_5]|uniref:transporter n=1 Tax=Lichenihabitans sp. Uapishka_5 TaxID=3037302 RepID=UPI0029E7ED7D|nr:transporter [Lichenihabitans sp. Uapishka_5]MDX7952508.1 transporter [Lichenihabitans sp. Uapishka_5]